MFYFHTSLYTTSIPFSCSILLIRINHARAIIYNLEGKQDLSLLMLEEVIKRDPQLKPLIRVD